MSDKQEDTKTGRSVHRWLYAGLGALALTLGGTYFYRTELMDRIMGTAEVTAEADEAAALMRSARETLLDTAARMRTDEAGLADLAIPTDAKGDFAPPLESEIPDGPYGESIRRGREIFLNPGSNAAEYVGNSMACANCHLDAGRRADAAPMWAAAVSYPAWRGKNEMINTMEDRIRGCFTYSMNAAASPAGTPPPSGDAIYKDLEAYFHWLATGAPNGVELPGAGYPVPEKPEAGYDRTRGAEVFEAKCAVCHGDDGQGQQDQTGRYVFPPLWGPDSYNWGAGMHRVNTAAGFIFANMPLGQPFSLTPQEAWDVAAYINSHERPADPRQPQQGLSVAEADEKYHNHPGYYGDEVDGEVIGAGVTGDPTLTPAATGTVIPQR